MPDCHPTYCIHGHCLTRLVVSCAKRYRHPTDTSQFSCYSSKKAYGGLVIADIFVTCRISVTKEIGIIFMNHHKTTMLVQYNYYAYFFGQVYT